MQRLGVDIGVLHMPVPSLDAVSLVGRQKLRAELRPALVKAPDHMGGLELMEHLRESCEIAVKGTGFPIRCRAQILEGVMTSMG